jgi:hypothetical protein
MDLSVILAAAQAAEHERSEVPFFICGGALASYAVLISVFGFRKPDFPATAVQARGVMMTGALLVVMAISAAIYVAL